jgi:hypothetical protein
VTSNRIGEKHHKTTGDTTTLGRCPAVSHPCLCCIYCIYVYIYSVFVICIFMSSLYRCIWFMRIKMIDLKNLMNFLSLMSLYNDNKSTSFLKITFIFRFNFYRNRAIQFHIDITECVQNVIKMNSVMNFTIF